MSIAQPGAGVSGADLPSNTDPAVAPHATPRSSEVVPAGTTPGTERDLQLHLGYQRVKPDLDAEHVNDLLQINLDVPVAVQTGLRSATEAARFEPQLKALCAAGFRLEEALQLRDRALALGHTHLEYTTATGTPDASSIQALFKARSRLVAYTVPLIEDGHLTEEAVGAHRGGFSQRDVAYNVIGLAGLYLKHWEQVQTAVKLKREEIEEMRAHANDVLLVLGVEKEDPDGAAVWAVERQRAFTLFMRAFTEMRHGIAFLRRTEGDLNEIIPSLYPKKKRPRKAAAPGNPPAQPDTTDSNDTETDAEDDPSDGALIEARDGTPPRAKALGNPGAQGRNGQAPEPPPPAIAIGLPGSPPTFGEDQ